MPRSEMTGPNQWLATWTVLCLSLVACAAGPPAGPPAGQELGRLAPPSRPLAAAPGIRLDVGDFGAVPNDGIDDRAAIQAAIDVAAAAAASGELRVEVRLPAGTFDLERGPDPGPGEASVLLDLPSGGFTMRGAIGPDPTIAGGASVLRVADNQAPWEALLGSRFFATAVDDLRLVDLTFDGNGIGNRVVNGDDTFSDLLRGRRQGIRVFRGDGLTIERCRFTDWHTVNVIVANGVDVSDVLIADCRFDAIGDADPVGPDWDHSTIYTDCDRAVIRNCTFESAGVGAFGARAAIETHGPRQTVFRNRVTGFTTGINATGVSALGSSVQLIAENRFLRVSDGIRIWAFEVAGNPAGEPVLDRCVIRDNEIVIDVDGWRVTQDPFSQAPKGIELFGQSDGVIEDLVIADNRIVFTNEGSALRAYDDAACGIRLFPAAVAGLPIRGLEMRGNVILNAPATGMYIGSGLPDGAVIAGNRIVDAGSGASPIAGGFRSAFILFGAYTDVSFEGNCVIDTGVDAPFIQQVHYLFGESLGGNRISGAGVVITSGEPVTFVRQDGDLGVPWVVDPPAETCPAP